MDGWSLSSSRPIASSAPECEKRGRFSAFNQEPGPRWLMVSFLEKHGRSYPGFCLCFCSSPEPGGDPVVENIPPCSRGYSSGVETGVVIGQIWAIPVGLSVRRM